jgi:carotenoid cleavage dioxygenase-like enzyme
MMHDFAASLHHSVILDLPLTMDPLNVVVGRPMLSFNRSLKSRFAVLPRYFDGEDDSAIKWFEDDEPSLIFHTADAWDEGLSGGQYKEESGDQKVAVNMFACRFKTSKLVYAAGGIDAPRDEEELSRELSDAVRLTYFRFSLAPEADPLYEGTAITHAFSLTAIPFEFPVICDSHGMRQHNFIYGCTLRSGAFDAALEGAKIDCILKVNAESLRQKGISLAGQGLLPRFADVDRRSCEEILSAQKEGIVDPDIAIFDLPAGLVGQEPSFVPKNNAVSEDDGYLLFYVYDEAQLAPNGDAPDDSKSQLWIIDASKVGVYPSTDALVGIVDLPARVPYGLHSSFITAEQIESQLEAKNPSAELIQTVTSTPESDMSDLRPRLRSSTLQVAENRERLEDTVEDAAQAKTHPAVLIWITALFWTLIQHVDRAMYSERARSLRLEASSRKRKAVADEQIRRQRSKSCVS